MVDDEIEKAMLFYIIFHEEQFELTEKDFANPIHQKIIKAINQLKLEKQEVSMLTIQNKIKDKADILNYLAYLGDYTAGTSAETTYNILKEYTKKRQILNLTKSIQSRVKETKNVDMLIEKIISACQKIEYQTEKEESFLNQVVNTSMELEKAMNKKEDYSLFTGFFELDNLTDGLHNGELTIIGARPGVGKTTFALQIAQKIASKGKYIAFASLEMSETQIIQKMLANMTKINSRKIRNGNLEDDEVEKISLACVELSELNFNILTKASSIQQIELEARRLKNKNKLDLLIIDYLQLLKNISGFKSREQEVADISRTLKLLSLELEIPIIALCQLNRNAVKQEPTLADIRESGAVEQDADNVIFLYQSNPEVDVVTVDLQKQRAGNTGKCELKFRKTTSEFLNIY